MSFGWIDPESYSINSLLLMDTWIVRYLIEKSDKAFYNNLAIGLAYNPAILWYFKNKCPDLANRIDTLIAAVEPTLTPVQVHEAECWLLDKLDSFVVYVYPAAMEELPYIQLWEPSHLLSITDFQNKFVLDIGSGTGRLTLAAASQASLVYACEPVDRLREHLRAKLKQMNITNVYVVDGCLEELPFPDEFFDIVISGHIFGDDYQVEDTFMSRVVKPGGWIIDCPGEDEHLHPDGPKPQMLQLGYKSRSYHSALGGDVLQYYRQK
jgi:SAM-dependent methyltransferase